MKTSPRQSLGRLGEDLAAQYLAEQGFAILARNVRTPYGEIDLLAQQGDLVVFVEVKTRRTRPLLARQKFPLRRASRHTSWLLHSITCKRTQNWLVNGVLTRSASNS